jgi:cytochrome P450
MKTIPNEGLIHIQDVFGYDYLLVTNHTALQDVLCTKVYDFAKPRHLRAAFNRILGPSLLSYEGERHKKERKTISPAFLPKGIREKSPHIWAKTLQLIREIDQRIDRSSCGNLEVELDVDELATYVTPRYTYMFQRNLASYVTT